MWHAPGNIVHPSFIIIPILFLLVYFLGIEENRKLTREYFQSCIRIFRRNQVVLVKTRPAVNKPCPDLHSIKSRYGLVKKGNI